MIYLYMYYDNIDLSKIFYIRRPVMKRKIFRRSAALACAVMMLFVTGCGNSAKESNNVKQEEVTTQTAGNENLSYMGGEIFASGRRTLSIEKCLLLHFNFKNTSDSPRSADDMYYVHIYQNNLEVDKSLYDVTVENEVPFRQSIMPGGEAKVYIPVELKKYEGKVTVHIIPVYSNKGGKEEKIEIDVDEIVAKYKEKAAKFFTVDNYKIECIKKYANANFIVSFDVTNNSDKDIVFDYVYSMAIVQNGNVIEENNLWLSLVKESQYAAEAVSWRYTEIEAGKKVRLCMELVDSEINPDEPITVKATPKPEAMGAFLSEISSGDISVIKY